MTQVEKLMEDLCRCEGWFPHFHHKGNCFGIAKPNDAEFTIYVCNDDDPADHRVQFEFREIARKKSYTSSLEFLTVLRNALTREIERG